MYNPPPPPVCLNYMFYYSMMPHPYIILVIFVESIAVHFLHSYTISTQNIFICILLFTIVHPVMFTTILCHAAIHFAY